MCGDAETSVRTSLLLLLLIMSWQRTDARGLPQVTKVSEGSGGTVITLVSIAVVVLLLAMAGACFKHYTQQVSNAKLGLGPEGGAETHFDYQVRETDFYQGLCLFVPTLKSDIL